MLNNILMGIKFIILDVIFLGYLSVSCYKQMQVFKSMDRKNCWKM